MDITKMDKFQRSTLGDEIIIMISLPGNLHIRTFACQPSSVNPEPFSDIDR